MRKFEIRVGVTMAFLVLGGLSGCGGSNAGRQNAGGGSGGAAGDEATGGSGGSSHETGGGGEAGGASGKGGTPGTGGAAHVPDASGGEADATTGAVDGNLPVDSAAPIVSDGGGTGSGVAVCWNDPKVIMICHQLENACINCGNGKNPPANKDAVDCFDLIKKAYAGMATDADCVKFATDHVCKPDDATTTGNVCGGLDCQAPGCKDRVKCEFVKQDGESDKCQPYVATCPCPAR
jgi:hypothetical protein